MISSEQVSDPVGSGGVLAIALAFYLCGCVALVVHGATLLTLHAFAAFIVLAVVAASNQLVPVLTGAQPAPARAVVILAAPLALGFALLLGAFAGVHELFAIAGPLLLAGSAIWAVWTITRVARAPLEPQTRAAVIAAATAFLIAAAIGAIMALALGGRAPAGVLSLAPAHASLAVIAFASTLVFAISYRFVPMFALAHTHERRWTRAAQWLVATAGGIGALGFIDVWIMRAAMALAAVAVIAAVGVHMRTLRARLRRRLDVSLRYAAVAWGCAFVAACCAFAATWRSEVVSACVALAVLGWLSLSILGYAFKIVGFLAWEYARRRLPAASLPPLGAAVPQELSSAMLILLAAGALCAAIALAIAPEALRLAAVLYAAGAFGAVSVLARLGWRYASVRG